MKFSRHGTGYTWNDAVIDKLRNRQGPNAINFQGVMTIRGTITRARKTQCTQQQRVAELK